ncbi:MAG: hypothetical protein A2V63_11955 [Candidatus Eisenbacteria bacterium RBG_19FT_COMBO_70_11]|nr:MAG: hypothetical protein A2V63_11955 [Candidatus Eisenbacteria bacterium RBG_19FT_COMBO_70_11]
MSGGERQRVALARILLEPANLILLDEPTHHLDLAGKEVLEGALEQYPGAIVVVTHDRSLMARLATRVVEITEGRAVVFPGGYDDYESSRVARARAAEDGRAAPGARVARATPSAPAPRAKERPPAAADRRRTARELERVEREIEQREARLRELEVELADPEVYHDGARARERIAEFERLRAEIESLWQRLGELA